jgi:hypothetical protein
MLLALGIHAVPRSPVVSPTLPGRPYLIIAIECHGIKAKERLRVIAESLQVRNVPDATDGMHEVPRIIGGHRILCDELLDLLVQATARR